MRDRWFMAAPCKHCPFRRDVTPFLHPERAAEISGLAWNPYNDFPCHKTIEHDDEGDGYATAESLTCAGFLTMQLSESGRNAPDGFEPSDNCYGDPCEMEEAYQIEWDRRRGGA